jgi:hypothetical protein
MNIVAPINQLGYGVASLNIVKHMAAKRKTSLWCLGQPQVTNQEDANIISQCLKNASFLDFNAPCIKIWHQHDMSQFAGKGRRIGFPIFELDEFSELEKHHLNSLDSLFVCSQWAKSYPQRTFILYRLVLTMKFLQPKITNNLTKPYSLTVASGKLGRVMTLYRRYSLVLLMKMTM